MGQKSPVIDSNSLEAINHTPTGSSSGGRASMFNNAQNTYITGGSFSMTTSNIGNGPLPLDALHKRAAPNAILNAGGRADEVRCHPGTREEVLGRIEKWRGARGSQTPPIFWLSGPAGAGKTAIVQTIAERCKARGIPQANFFFFRTDPSRNSLSPLVATLVHQIILLYPALRDPIAAVLFNNPLILESTLEDQLTQLIVTPLQTTYQSSSSYLKPLLLLDGLDECMSEEKRSQRQILQAFDKVLAENPDLFRLLVASRDESQIRAAFNDVSSGLLPLYLDDQYQPEKDIRVFVVDAFERLRKTHPLAHTLPAAWPSVNDVDAIVKKSSGQFIYAATVMRFVMISSANPTLSLARVQGAAEIPVKSKSPFFHLDALYRYILSQVDDQEAIKDILHGQLLLQGFHGTHINTGDLLEGYSPKYTRAMIESCLADVSPIARYTNNGVLFYHASFPDYLLNSSRSEDYFVDLPAFNLRVQVEIWGTYDNTKKRYKQVLFNHIGVPGMMRLSQLPPGFLDTVTRPLKAQNWSGYGVKSFDLFKHLYSLCNSDDDVMKYRRIVREWANDRAILYHNKSRPGRGNAPPYAGRYIAMSDFEACVRSGMFDDISSELFNDLIPETAADVPETAGWLTALLRRIHEEVFGLISKGDFIIHTPSFLQKHHTSAPVYNLLLRKWVSWATQNDIPLNGVDDLPNVRWYRAMAAIERNVTIDISLHREKDCDIPQTAAWLSDLLHRIHKEKYHTSVHEYNQLLQKWVSWATWNDIPLDGVRDLPNAWWYLWWNRIEKWGVIYLGFGRRPQ